MLHGELIQEKLSKNILYLGWCFGLQVHNIPKLLKGNYTIRSLDYFLSSGDQRERDLQQFSPWFEAVDKEEKDCAILWTWLNGDWNPALMAFESFTNKQTEEAAFLLSCYPPNGLLCNTTQ